MPVQDRKDRWTNKDDSVLAETTLRHIRTGSTQLKAFDEVAEVLGRTFAACGFRWNSEVRKRCEEEINKAKQERLKTRREPSKKFESVGKLAEKEVLKNHPLLAAIEVINQFIENEKKKKENKQTSDSIIDEMSAMLLEGDHEIESLKKQLDEAREAEYAVTDDYKSLIQILQRARDTGVLTGKEEDARPGFKMDKSGNIERIIG